MRGPREGCSPSLVIKKPDSTEKRGSKPRRAESPASLRARVGMAIREITGGSIGGGRFVDSSGRMALGADGRPVPRETYSDGHSVFRLGLDIHDREEASRPYEENPWVRAAVKAISEGFQRLNFCIYTGDPMDESSRKIEDHPLLELLADPNPLMSPREFWRANAVGMKHDGEVVWFLTDSEGNPASFTGDGSRVEQVVPVRGDYVQVDHDQRGWPKSYRYTTTYGQSSTMSSPEFAPDQVVHFRDHDPYNTTRGLGDVEALERETDLYFEAFRAMDASVRNGGDPGGFIIYKHPVANDELDRRQDVIDEEMSGPNQRRYKVLEAEAQFVPNPVKPSDMQYQQLLTWIRDSILAALGVPGPVVGVYDSATFNNVETAHREMWQGPNGILALAAMFADGVTRVLTRMSPGQNLVAYFDSSNIEALREDTGEKIDRAIRGAQAGVGVSFNELLGLQGVEVPETPDEGDRKWVAQGLTDLDDPEAGKGPMPDMTPAGGGEEEEDEGNDSGGDDADDESLSRPHGGLEFYTPVETEAEVKLRKRVAAWLDRYQAAQLKKLRSIARTGRKQFAGLDDQVNPEAMDDESWLAILLVSSEWSAKLARQIRVPIREAMQEALGEAAAEVGSGVVASTDINVVEALRRQVVNVSEGVTSTTAKRVRNAIGKVLVKQAPPGNLRDMIKAVLPELTAELAKAFGSKEARASAVARTEVGKAENAARVIQYEASDVEEVMWVSSVDDAVRPTHLAVHGEKIQLGGRFQNGLRFPHDPQAPASEVVNCRCKLRAVSFRNPLDDLDPSDA